ncbi:MAG: hypothetical protein II997_00160 [Clostridia bacterium]|nr:hypothetical protein [Clostridia bacterium]
MSATNELIAHIIAEQFTELLEEKFIDLPKQAETIGLCLISEVQQILMNEVLDDFNAIEEIVCLFEKHHLNTGFRHDFG